MSETNSAREAQRWLRYATEDFSVARLLLGSEDAPPRVACVQAQQAAEKMLKGALIFLQVEFPRTHDLVSLREKLPTDWLATQLATQFADLSSWAVEGRYPGDWPEATREHAVEAVAQAEEILGAVRADLIRLGYLTSTD